MEGNASVVANRNSKPTCQLSNTTGLFFFYPSPLPCSSSSGQQFCQFRTLAPFMLEILWVSLRFENSTPFWCFQFVVEEKHRCWFTSIAPFPKPHPCFSPSRYKYCFSESVGYSFCFLYSLDSHCWNFIAVLRMQRD